MSNVIKLPTEPIEQVLSQPYKTEAVGYFVNVFNGKSKASKRKFNFDTKDEATEFYNNNAGKWRIDFTDLLGNPLPDAKSLLFDSKPTAQIEYMKLMDKNKDASASVDDEIEDKVIEQLERTFEQYLPSAKPRKKSSFSDLPDLDREDDEQEQDTDVVQAEEKYIEASSLALNEAKNLLSSIAELYIEKGVLDKFPYFKNKLYFEESSIQMIHTQMMISQLVLKKFFKQVIKNPTSKNIESLSKIQMSQLALSKYQREYLSDVEESFKKLKKDYTNGEFINQSGVEEGEAVTDAPVINDRKKLIMELTEVTESEQLIPLSPNQNLRNNIKSDDKDKYESTFKINSKIEESEDVEIPKEVKSGDLFNSFID